MVGLDAAGKTTILYKLKLGEIVTTIPTIGVRGGGAPGGDPSPSGLLGRGLVAPRASVSLRRRSPQGSTWRQWSTRTSASPCGTWVGRTRSGPSGGITSKTPRVGPPWGRGEGMGLTGEWGGRGASQILCSQQHPLAVPRADLRGGQQRPGAGERGAGGAHADAGGGRAAGRRPPCLRQQAGGSGSRGEPPWWGWDHPWGVGAGGWVPVGRSLPIPGVLGLVSSNTRGRTVPIPMVFRLGS